LAGKNPRSLLLVAVLVPILDFLRKLEDEEDHEGNP
jgi:hypothetical protein